MNMHTALPDADYGVRTAPDTVRIERLLPGPIERVWQYLTDPQLRAQWFAGGELEPRTGGRMDLQFHNSTLTENDDPPPPKYANVGDHRMQCVVTEFDPPHVLGFTFGSNDPPSQVRIELSRQGEQVRLLLVHSRLATREGMLSVSAGWHAHLNILRARMTGQTPDGLWRTHTRLETEYAQRLP